MRPRGSLPALPRRDAIPMTGAVARMAEAARLGREQRARQKNCTHRWEIDLDSYDPWGWRTVHCARCKAYWGTTHPEHGDLCELGNRKTGRRK